MKHFTYLLGLLFLLPLFFGACDKMDCNGALDGNWQLTRWESRADGKVLADNTTGIYYTVKLELIAFNHYENRVKLHSRFRHEGDTLFITTVYARPFDEPVSLDTLEQFGIGPDGKLHIEVLDGDRMILSTPSSLLIFRRY